MNQIQTYQAPRCQRPPPPVVTLPASSHGMTEEVRTVRYAETLIRTIDLRLVKAKLMDPEEGKGWSQDFAGLVERRYRRFLAMIYIRRDGSIVPTKDIDLMWHQHILSTEAYAEDCERVFGEFVHHFPFFGMRGDADAANLRDSFGETVALYFATFGEPYVLAEIEAAGPSQTRCGSGRCVRCGSGPVRCHHPRVT